MSVRDLQGVYHRFTPEVLDYTAAYQHQRTVCHRWFARISLEMPNPVTCLWCVAGLSRFGGSDG